MARLGRCPGPLAVRSASTRQDPGSWPNGSDQLPAWPAVTLMDLVCPWLRRARPSPWSGACPRSARSWSEPNTVRTWLNSLSARHVSEVAGHLSTQLFTVIGYS